MEKHQAGVPASRETGAHDMKKQIEDERPSLQLPLDGPVNSWQTLRATGHYGLNQGREDDIAYNEKTKWIPLWVSISWLHGISSPKRQPGGVHGAGDYKIYILGENQLWGRGAGSYMAAVWWSNPSPGKIDFSKTTQRLTEAVFVCIRIETSCRRQKRSWSIWCYLLFISAAIALNNGANASARTGFEGFDIIDVGPAWQVLSKLVWKDCFFNKIDGLKGLRVRWRRSITERKAHSIFLYIPEWNPVFALSAR